ncbi:MAG: hypothetical protein GKR94_11555 [Gammaproteobacteria bacterium]|nr:hypothetical protein [Gammaproteobacteria bacterium]
MQTKHHLSWVLALLMLAVGPARAEPVGDEQTAARTSTVAVKTGAAGKTEAVGKAPENTGTETSNNARAAQQQAAKEQIEALDLDALTERLRGTDALGFFTKLELKSQMDNLVDGFKSFYDHKRDDPAQLEQLRERFELLLLKVMTLVQDGDPELSADIAFAEPQLWDVLNNPQELAKL